MSNNIFNVLFHLAGTLIVRAEWDNSRVWRFQHLITFQFQKLLGRKDIREHNSIHVFPFWVRIRPTIKWSSRIFRALQNHSSLHTNLPSTREIQKYGNSCIHGNSFIVSIRSLACTKTHRFLTPTSGFKGFRNGITAIDHHAHLYLP